jgi:DNA-directed RNA polymerase alpha subunit
VLDSMFNAAEELRRDPEFEATIAAVPEKGIEVVGALELKVKQKPSPSLPDDTRLEDVDLPTRIHKVLALNGIRTVGELRRNTRRNPANFPGFRTSISCLCS